MEMWILSEAQASPFRKAGASRKRGTSGEGFRITPRRIPTAAVVLEYWRGRRRDRRPISSEEREGFLKAILPLMIGKVVGYNQGAGGGVGKAVFVLVTAIVKQFG